MEGQVTDVEQEVIITNNNLLLHFSCHNNNLLVVKQWKGALNRITPSLLGLLKNNDLALRANARPLSLRMPQSTGINLIFKEGNLVMCLQGIFFLLIRQTITVLFFWL